MPREPKQPPKQSPPEKRKRLLEQMDEWVHDIDVVLESEPAIVKRS